MGAGPGASSFFSDGAETELWSGLPEEKYCESEGTRVVCESFVVLREMVPDEGGVGSWQ